MKAIAMASAGLLVLAGCAQMPRRAADVTIPSSAERLRTVSDASDNAEIELQTQLLSRVFSARTLSSGDPLPRTGSFKTTVSEGGLMDALLLMTSSQGLGLVVEGGARAPERYGASTAVRVSGNFAEVVDRLSGTFGFFYSLRDGVLYVSSEERFVVDLPPALNEDTLAGITNTLQFLGGQDMYLDRLTRTATYRANRTVSDSIDRYLRYVRQTRSLLLYDIHVFQVDLADGESSGINWRSFTYNSAGIPNSTSSAGLKNDGTNSKFGLGAVIAGPRFQLDVLMDFLKSQGTLRVITQPQVSLISGSKANLRVGDQRVYVSRVAQSQAANTGTTVASVETDRVLTGFELALSGEEHDGTIYTRISLRLSDLTRLDNVTLFGATVSLPQTSERTISTIARARAGDVVLLGGLAAKRDSRDGSTGITGFNSASETKRSELVIALRPRIVRYAADGLGPLPDMPRLPAEMVPGLTTTQSTERATLPDSASTPLATPAAPDGQAKSAAVPESAVSTPVLPAKP